MTNFLKWIAKDLIFTILFTLACIGYPLYQLYVKYNLSEIEVTKWKLGFLMALILITVFGKFLLQAFIFALPLTWYKRLLWGINQAILPIIVYLTSKWLVANAEFVINMMFWTSITNIFAYYVAPSYVISWKNQGH